MKKLQVDKAPKDRVGFKNSEDLDINTSTTLDKPPAKSRQTLRKSKANQPSTTTTKPAKAPPGIRNIQPKKQIGKGERSVEKQKNSFANIRWRAI